MCCRDPDNKKWPFHVAQLMRMRELSLRVVFVVARAKGWPPLSRLFLGGSNTSSRILTDQLSLKLFLFSLVLNMHEKRLARSANSFAIGFFMP